MHQILGVDDSTGYEKGVDFLLEELVAFEEVAEVCDSGERVSEG